jgi:hypothetical protein
MNIKATAVSSFAKFILGGLIFNKIKDIVAIYNKAELSGDEKRSAAIKDIEDVGFGISTWAINLGIELAVTYFNTIK